MVVYKHLFLGQFALIEKYIQILIFFKRCC
jgi:hypothetical protein